MPAICPVYEGNAARASRGAPPVIYPVIYTGTRSAPPASTIRAAEEVRLAGHDTDQVGQIEQAEHVPDFAPDVAEGAALAHELIDVLVDRQASDVVLLDLSRLSAFADFFIIATVDNVRQARAIVDALDTACTSAGVTPSVEGGADEGWVLIDAGRGVFIHLFSLEARVYYNLEGLWHRAQEVVRIQ